MRPEGIALSFFDSFSPSLPGPLSRFLSHKPPCRVLCGARTSLAPFQTPRFAAAQNAPRRQSPPLRFARRIAVFALLLLFFVLGAMVKRFYNGLRAALDAAPARFTARIKKVFFRRSQSPEAVTRQPLTTACFVTHIRRS